MFNLKDTHNCTVHGHQFEPRYTTKKTKAKEEKIYICDVCVKCGAVLYLKEK